MYWIIVRFACLKIYVLSRRTSCDNYRTILLVMPITENRSITGAAMSAYLLDKGHRNGPIRHMKFETMHLLPGSNSSQIRLPSSFRDSRLLSLNPFHSMYTFVM